MSENLVRDTKRGPEREASSGRGKTARMRSQSFPYRDTGYLSSAGQGVWPAKVT